MARNFWIATLMTVLAGMLGAQGFGWAFCVGDLGNDVATRIAADSADNIYVTGYFEGTVDFDPGPGVVSRTSAGMQDIFVAKYSPVGALLWVDAFGSSNDDRGFDLCTDAAGNVYITGQFWHSVDFDPGPGTTILTVTFPGGGGAPDPFVLKLDTSGALVWARNFGGASNDEGRAIRVDSTGNVYVAGLYYNYVGIPNDFDPGPAVLTLPSAATSGWKDIFVSKFDAAGILVWASGIVGAWVKGVADIEVDSLGRVLICGDYQQTVDFDPGTGTQNRTTASQDGFVLQLTANGGFDWVETLGNSTGASAVSVSCVLPGPLDTLTICGQFWNGPVDLDPSSGVSNQTAIGNSDMFFARWDSSHGLTWLRTIGSTSATSPEYALDLITDPNGNLYIAGQYQGNTDFDPGSGVFTLNGLTDTSSFSLILDSSGDFVWAGSYGNPSDTDSATGIALDGNFNIVLCGSMRGTGDFDPTTGVFNLTSAGPGGSGAPVDIYLVKLTQDFPRLEVRESSPTSGAFIVSGASAAGGRDFGSQNVYSGPTTALIVYLKNTGAAPMTLGLPALTGAQSAEFVIDTTGYTTTVAAGSNTTFLISFDPTVAGAKSATVTFTHDATMWVATPFTFGVAGLAVEPAMSVPATPLSFATPAAGTPSTPQSYFVSVTDLVSGVQVIAPAAFEVSASAAGPWMASFTLPTTGGTVFVRYVPISGTSHSGNISHSTTGLSPMLLNVQGDVVPNPTPSSKKEDSGCTLQEADASFPGLLLLGFIIGAASARTRIKRGLRTLLISAV
ncbi:MAG: SBBP repeat-containing protein [Planctomycetes bacterium]|nr:SBBP repeat-containing protein [Planctomycetota bacterium]